MHELAVQELIEAARSVQGTIELRKPEFTAASVGAAIRASSGTIYTGVSIHLACGVGFCAEHSAVAEMLKGRETEIQAVVSVSAESILPPCGRCRELMMQLDEKNAEAIVVLSDGRALKLGELLPDHWLSS